MGDKIRLIILKVISFKLFDFAWIAREKNLFIYLFNVYCSELEQHKKKQFFCLALNYNITSSSLKKHEKYLPESAWFKLCLIKCKKSAAVLQYFFKKN